MAMIIADYWKVAFFCL